MSYINIPLFDACPWISTYIKMPEFFDKTTLFLSSSLTGSFVCLGGSTGTGNSRFAFSSLGTSPMVEDPLEDSANEGLQSKKIKKQYKNSNFKKWLSKKILSFQPMTAQHSRAV